MFCNNMNHELLTKISNNLRNYRNASNKLRKEGNNFTKAVINVYRAKGRPASPQTHQRLYQPYLNLHKLNSNAYYKYMASVRNLIAKTGGQNRRALKNALSNEEKKYVRNYAAHVKNKAALERLLRHLPLPQNMARAEIRKHLSVRPK